MIRQHEIFMLTLLSFYVTSCVVCAPTRSSSLPSLTFTLVGDTRCASPVLTLAGGARCASPVMETLGPEGFAEELRRRGLQTALDQLADDGPSAFKDPCKVIEYVMLNLQHRPKAEAIREAMRFTCREPGKSSFVSGLALSDRRVSWHKSRFVGGYISGKALTLEEFTSELETVYPYLIGCATWRFSVLHPTTFEPLARSAADDFLREYVLLVDEQPVVIRLLYDWGCWCFLVASVELLSEPGMIGEVSVGESWSQTGSPSPDVSDSRGDNRKRSRGGSL